MNSKEFKELSEVQKVELVNARLKELKEEGKGTKDFKSEKTNFSYATAIKELETLGYARNGNEFVKETKLNDYEILMLKNLAYGYEFVMSKKVEEPKVKRRPEDNATTTSVRMYNQVWKRWQEFSKEWSIYNSIDLMASALEEYMDKHDFEDYQRLVEQGKIKEDKK